MDTRRDRAIHQVQIHGGNLLLDRTVHPCACVSDLGTEKTSANALLLKYARMSTDSSGRKVFNSKRPL